MAGCLTSFGGPAKRKEEKRKAGRTHTKSMREGTEAEKAFNNQGTYHDSAFQIEIASSDPGLAKV